VTAKVVIIWLCWEIHENESITPIYFHAVAVRDLLWAQMTVVNGAGHPASEGLTSAMALRCNLDRAITTRPLAQPGTSSGDFIAH
jgi:hypothetical protein